MSFILAGWGIEGMRKRQWDDKETGKKGRWSPYSGRGKDGQDEELFLL